MPASMKRDKKKIRLNKKKIEKAKRAYHSSSSDNESDSDYEKKDAFTSQFVADADGKSLAQKMKESGAGKRKRFAKDEFSPKDEVPVSSSDDDDGYGNENDDDHLSGVDEDDDDHMSVSSNGEDTSSGAAKPKITAAQKMMMAIQKTLGKADNEEQKSKQPILSKKKDVEHQLDDMKLESKAKKVLAAEKKKKEEVGRVIPDHSNADYERQLRKVGTKGVVQLFNAIREAQKTADTVAGDSIQKHKQEVPSLSKEVFLKSLKSETSKSAKSITTSSSTKRASEPSISQDGPAWVQKDFAMSAPKHWDEEDDEELPELH